MKYSKIVIGGAAISVFLIVIVWLGSSRQQEFKPLPLQTDARGEVSVAVLPTAIAGEEWLFEVTLDTHSAELSEDIAQAAFLIDALGAEHPPLRWQGDPPGGHHRSGLLYFAPLTAEPRIITLVLRDVGGIAERRFEWLIGPPR